ncbi:type III-B CRISPR module-associated protein Cmr5 [Prolixibacteraceae bacterium JC049]|nr:type III-B CRISPR module-associated protein Cmr5 [Prolixibacteraceae bacterium JC049]
MKQRIENYFPLALEALEEFEIVNNGNIKKPFNGYVSSFGASIIQSSLLPTIAFYKAVETSAEAEREKIIDAIFWIVNNSVSPNNLFEYVQNHGNKELLVEKLLDAATALKLAIRTFNLIEP